VPDLGDRRTRLLGLVAAQAAQNPGDSTPSLLGRICHAVCQDMHSSGAGITLMSRSGWRGVITATSPLTEQREELQFIYGEGPSFDAFRFGHPILVDDLEDTVWKDWAGYAPAAQAGGVRAVFAFPLQVGAARLGALDIYREVPGPLTAGELADGMVFADLALNALLDGQEAARAGHLDAGMDEAIDYRIYQAQGMVSVQLRIDLVESMARLRAHALGNESRLSDVADQVLSGDLHLDSGGT
jgi:hypothetical protein